MKFWDGLCYGFLGFNGSYLCVTGILGSLGYDKVPEPGLRMILGSSLVFIVFLLASQRRER